jgi:hypothetical protein
MFRCFARLNLYASSNYKYYGCVKNTNHKAFRHAIIPAIPVSGPINDQKSWNKNYIGRICSTHNRDKKCVNDLNRTPWKEETTREICAVRLAILYALCFLRSFPTFFPLLSPSSLPLSFEALPRCSWWGLLLCFCIGTHQTFRPWNSLLYFRLRKLSVPR